jgi:hypothetical protein
MKKFLAVLVAVAVGCVMMTGVSLAKDEALEKDLAILEKSYIPPLFYTSAPAMDPSVKGMVIYKAKWNAFKAEYYFYKPDYANWQRYFDEMQWAIDAADAIVLRSKATGRPADLPLAHDELEKVRLAMLELRPKNGFPKFVTDKLTVYHEPMEFIVLSLKGKTPDQLTDELLAEVTAALPEAQKAWSDVVKCPVDQQLWNLTDAQMATYANNLTLESANLDAFAAALASGDKGAILRAGSPTALKAPFVTCYTTFGDYTPFVK